RGRAPGAVLRLVVHPPVAPLSVASAARFALGAPLRSLAVFGCGMAAAVLVAATVGRMVLVPAVMQILGPANWWLPRWAGRGPAIPATEPDGDHHPAGGLARTRPAARD